MLRRPRDSEASPYPETRTAGWRETRQISSLVHRSLTTGQRLCRPHHISGPFRPAAYHLCTMDGMLLACKKHVFVMKLAVLFPYLPFEQSVDGHVQSGKVHDASPQQLRGCSSPGAILAGADACHACCSCRCCRCFHCHSTALPGCYSSTTRMRNTCVCLVFVVCMYVCMYHAG
jgi:hypothetical protein